MYFSSPKLTDFGERRGRAPLSPIFFISMQVSVQIGQKAGPPTPPTFFDLIALPTRADYHTMFVCAMVDSMNGVWCDKPKCLCSAVWEILDPPLLIYL